MNETITQNIPLNDIQSVYVHIELIICIADSTSQSIVSCGSILLGNHTRYRNEWLKIIEQHRKTHQGWYPFFG